MKNTTGIYVASRVSRAPMWRGLRDNGGVPITSTWIDEDGEGQTADFGELWTRCAREIAASTGLVFYADVNDAPWKGALVEVGIALALGKPVGVVQLGEFEGRTMRPVGSWIHHPAVKVTRYISEAIDHAQGGTPRPEGLRLGETIVPTRFLTDFLKALDFHGGHGTPSFDRVQAELMVREAKSLLLSTSANTSRSPLVGHAAATKAVPADLWDEIVDFITDQVDVRDGADGPTPNTAMSLSTRIDQEVK